MFYRRFFLHCLFAFSLLLLIGSSYGFQSGDLSGVWRDDVGGQYILRQSGNTLVWWDDRRPTVMNVFFGTISGSTIAGRWLDLPGGQLLSEGSITLRIESNDRLVKTGSSIAYGGTVLTRIGGSSGDACVIQYLDWNDAGQSVSLTAGNDIYYKGWGGSRWVARLDRARNTFIHAPNGDFSKAHTDDFMNYVDASGRDVTSPHLPQCGASTGGDACVIQYLDWNDAGQSVSLTAGKDIYYKGWGGSRWVARLDRARNTFIHAPNGDFSKAHTDDFMNYVDASGRNVTSPHLSQCGASTGGDTKNTGAAGLGGICSDPRALAIMDEWLARAIPPQRPGESLRYESWGRLVGRSLTATVTVPGKPDTPLTRCEYLWVNSPNLTSTSGLGTLRQYVEQRLR
jgi:protein gp37